MSVSNVYVPIRILPFTYLLRKVGQTEVAVSITPSIKKVVTRSCENIASFWF